MSTALEMLHQAAARLQQEGKKPSLALFKARLSGQLSAPALFAAYQQWRQQPVSSDTRQLATVESQLVAHVTVNPADLQRLEAKLDKILALLEQQHVPR
ncbi:hypothetical protein VT06_03860 [Arsukibacterium sp. MJ3]|jgi:hypothetical protein|uniref:hypothetical protein n=1 Tax=Arsukibacterium sp. MJ3 TaxID=1632859 RepID=UPI0006273DFE|nr:hypothetical protein [Arsukibacterium sp. MJ3]KKO50126.1 hypothetical protein VT06_03860 [Arsukibacterium sp. MJ3]